MTTSALTSEDRAVAEKAVNARVLQNFVGGRWIAAQASGRLDLTNPANGEVLARVPLSGHDDVEAAVSAASTAWPDWRARPVGDRTQYIYALREQFLKRRLCRGDDVAEHRSLQCFDVAERITYLDTVESLAIEVREIDGRNHGWENGFWDAIRQSSHPHEALRMMTSRMQEPDFQVSTSVLEWLASSELRIEVPDAFQSGMPANYHALAVEKLRKYVRLLGNSLSKKNSNVLPESAKAYRTFAEQNNCERESLISAEERSQVLAAIAHRP